MAGRLLDDVSSQASSYEIVEARDLHEHPTTSREPNAEAIVAGECTNKPLRGSGQDVEDTLSSTPTREASPEQRMSYGSISPLPAQGSPKDMRSLEHHYMSLLEQRIAQLESRLKLPRPPPPRHLPRRIKASPKVDSDSESSDTGLPKKTIKPTNEASRPRVRSVVSQWNQRKNQRVESDRKEAATQDDDYEGCTTFRLYVDNAPRNSPPRPSREELHVGSEGLKDLLSRTLQHCMPYAFKAKVVKFFQPFYLFIWNWEELEEACKPDEADNEQQRMAREDLTEVLSLLRNGNALSSYFKDIEPNKMGKTVTFESLANLFQPGTKVLLRSFQNELQIFEVRASMRITGVRASARGFESFLLLLASFDWDGVSFKNYNYHVDIQSFEDEVLVTDLACFPVSYYGTDSDPDGTVLMEELLQRGKKFYEICTSKQFQFEYTGQVLHRKLKDRAGPPEPSPDPKDSNNNSLFNTVDLPKSKVIIDNYSFMRSRRNIWSGNNPLGTRVGFNGRDDIASCQCPSCQSTCVLSWAKTLERAETGPELNEQFRASDDRLRMCPPKVLGYTLKTRYWAQFAIKGIERIDPNTAAEFDEYFDNKLELDENPKKLLKAMVENHTNTKSAGIISDVVQGKGQGLAILLHGPPGVGKTLTAETVALASSKPLLSISTAEVGIEPNQAEKNLIAIFEDAGRWNAIILLDEADVFLEERKGTKDLQRNSLVAVFLRVLEYYEGIVILTTNRITSLDVAVQSRIHLAIQYHELTTKQKEKIFRYFLDEAADRISGRDEIDRALPKILRKKRINGRQIRNVLRSAFLLAQADRKKLSLDHIEEVMDATEAFLDSLKDVTMLKREFLDATPTN